MRYFSFILIFLTCLQCCNQKPSVSESQLSDDYVSIKTQMVDINMSNQVLSQKQLETFRLLKRFIETFPLSQNTLFVLAAAKNLSSVQFDSLYNNLSPTLRDNPNWRSVDLTRSQIQTAETGKPFPGIILYDTLKKPLKTASFKGKILFIDFWSSWCVSCRQQFPHLKVIYSKNQSKGFEIIGISMDEKRDAWLRALRQDQLPWRQYCELVPFQENSLAMKFKIMGIPANFLLDKNGIIIGQDLSPKELETVVSRL